MADCNNCSSYLSSEDIIRRSVKCSGGSVAFIGSNVNPIDPAIPIINDGNTVCWFKSDDLSTITKDGSNFVSQWNSVIGTNHLKQTVGVYQPLHTGSGIIFDGINNSMKTDAFPLVQPEHIYIVFKQLSWISGFYIFDGHEGASGGLIQNPIATKLRAYAGVSLDGDAVSIGSYSITRVLFNGVSSKITTNSGTPIVGNAGIVNMGGLTLGARGNNSSRGNFEVKEIIIRKISDSPTNEAAIYNYLKTKHSL